MKGIEMNGEIVVTKNAAGQIVAVTRQDEEGRILSVLAESEPAAVAVPNEREAFEVWAKGEGLIGEGFGIRSEWSNLGVVRKAWEAGRAALAATPAADAQVPQGSYVSTSGELKPDVSVYSTPAAAPVVLPPPDLWRDAEGLRGYAADPGNGPWYTAETVRALLATATGLPAQAVPLKLIEAINTACGGNEWQGDALATDLLQPACRAIASLAPQAQADARDADGEAFRTAARLGLTLRFYGNCAQSGAPGTPSVYEVTTGPDSAEAMRASIDRAAIAAAKGN